MSAGQGNKEIELRNAPFPTALLDVGWASSTLRSSSFMLQKCNENTANFNKTLHLLNYTVYLHLNFEQ